MLNFESSDYFQSSPNSGFCKKTPFSVLFSIYNKNLISWIEKRMILFLKNYFLYEFLKNIENNLLS